MGLTDLSNTRSFLSFSGLATLQWDDMMLIPTLSRRGGDDTMTKEEEKKNTVARMSAKLTGQEKGVSVMTHRAGAGLESGLVRRKSKYLDSLYIPLTQD